MDETLYQGLRRIQLEWELTDEIMAKLVHLTPAQYAEALKEAMKPDSPTVPRGLERGVSLVSIQKRLALHYPDSADQVRWLTTPNVALSSPENQAWLAYYLASFSEKPEEPQRDET